MNALPQTEYIRNFYSPFSFARYNKSFYTSDVALRVNLMHRWWKVVNEEDEWNRKKHNLCMKSKIAVFVCVSWKETPIVNEMSQFSLCIRCFYILLSAAATREWKATTAAAAEAATTKIEIHPLR